MYLTDESWLALTRDDLRKVILANVDMDPGVFALKQSDRDFPYATVATQLKYLQKAVKKLPTYHHHRALIPPRAYEQSSSEAVANLKELQGDTLLDLTLGLGVDARRFAQDITKVTALEQDAVLARITGYNFGLFGLSNVEIRSGKSEEFLKSYRAAPFDWVYADPARRDERGQRVHALGDLQPDLTALWPELQRVGRRLMVKASPLLDLQAAAQALPGVRALYLHSLDGEVKELLIEADLSASVYSPLSQVQVHYRLRYGAEVMRYTLPLLPEPLAPQAQCPAEPAYLCEPDPAFYKHQSLAAWIKRYHPEWPAWLNHPRGFFFSDTAPEPWPGRIFRLQERLPYKPKALKRFFKQQGLSRLNVLRRHFPLDVRQIRQQLQLQEGGDQFLICTTWAGEKVAWLAERCVVR